MNEKNTGIVRFKLDPKEPAKLDGSGRAETSAGAGEEMKDEGIDYSDVYRSLVGTVWTRARGAGSGGEQEARVRVRRCDCGCAELQCGRRERVTRGRVAMRAAGVYEGAREDFESIGGFSKLADLRGGFGAEEAGDLLGEA